MKYVKAQTNTTTLNTPAGLPKVEWTILHMDDLSRENLCHLQMGYCSNNCGGPSHASRNFCNATSMAWSCTCSGSMTMPDFNSWPVPQAECTGKGQACQMICNEQHSNSCASACNNYYLCGTEKAPPSYLQTERSTDTPSYDGPKKEIANTTRTGATPTQNVTGATTSHADGFIRIPVMIILSSWIATLFFNLSLSLLSV